ncbi:MAG TPA: sulfotransferase domain-containing protein [Terriglobales bacterium]
MEPLLAYFGHHKCGTTWIQQIIDHVCQSAHIKAVHHHNEAGFAGDIVACRQAQQFDFWCYSNADVTFVRDVPLKGFHVVRDPRDIITSAYFSHLYSHPEGDWKWLKRHRPYLLSLSKHDGLMAEIEFSARTLGNMLTWNYTNPNILEARFEDMIANNVERFAEVFGFLGLFPKKLSVQQIMAATEKYSFANLSKGRTRGQQNNLSHYRKGQPGDWRNHFDASHVDYFKRLYNPLLLKLGYETEEDWRYTAPHTAAEDTAHEQGLRLFHLGKYAEAARLFHEALLETENAERWNDWATAVWFCGHAKEAELGYQHALRFDPTHSEAASNLNVVRSKSNVVGNLLSKAATPQ